MGEALIAAGTLGLLLLGSASGCWLQARLPMHERRGHSLNAIGLISTMLVTFAALVLGLLVTSVKTDFDQASTALRAYGISLLQLDQRLRHYGPETQPVRADLRAFTAAAVAHTWPGEPRPSGQYPTGLHRATSALEEPMELTLLLRSIGRAVRTLGLSGQGAPTPDQVILAASARGLMDQAERQRWIVVANSTGTLSWPFLAPLRDALAHMDQPGP